MEPLVSQFITFRNREYTRVNPCLILGDKHFLVDQMWSSSVQINSEPTINANDWSSEFKVIDDFYKANYDPNFINKNADSPGETHRLVSCLIFDVLRLVDT